MHDRSNAFRMRRGPHGRGRPHRRGCGRGPGMIYSEGRIFTYLTMFGYGHGGSVIGILTLILLIWALVDIIKAPRDGMWKLIWVIICLVLPLIGPILYYFLGRKSAPPRTV